MIRVNLWLRKFASLSLSEPIICMDILTREKRSWNMSRVRDRDTKPELAVRSAIHRMGFRFRLRRRDLPGNPDIVLPRHKKIVLVHGCFWHQHPGCSAAKRPSSNKDFWEEKLDQTVARDNKNLAQLRELGWGPLVLWQCEVEKAVDLYQKLRSFLMTPSGNG